MAGEVPARKPAYYSTKVVDLIGAGLIRPGDQLVSVLPAWPAAASVNADGSVNYNGQNFGSPSSAGAAVRQGKATNGWSMWAVKTGTKLRKLADIRAEHDEKESGTFRPQTPDQPAVAAGGAGQLPSADDGVSNEAVALPPVAPIEDAAESPGLITSFGMFWRREDLNLTQGGKLRLLGHQAGKRGRIDFADQVGVYLLHDGARTMYVGRVTKPRMGMRLAEHTRDRLAGRWDRFSWFGLRPVLATGQLGDTAAAFGTDLVVATMEAILIEGLEPPQNRRQGDGMTGQEYQQARDDQLQERVALETMVRVFQERIQQH